MTSSALIHLIVYAAIGVFVGAVAWRAWKIYRLPLNLRWELYPVAHEAGDRASYGGSRLEELDWWTKPQESSLLNELRYMIPEMTLLVGLWRHNRKLWRRSFPFHFGLYTLAGLLGLLVLGALLEFGDVPVSNRTGQLHVIGTPVFYLTKLAALAGLTLAMAGAIGLLHRRLFDPDLRDFTSFGHVFNLAVFIGLFAIAWLAFIFADTDFVATRSFIRSLLRFDLFAPIGGERMNHLERALLALEIVAAVLVIAYIPLTHMSHFFIKWFTYHGVRWDDRNNEVGSAIEKKIAEQVTYPVSWSAPHIQGDGHQNWLDVITRETPK